MNIDDMTPREAYEVGYRNGESSIKADLDFALTEDLGIEYEGHPITAVREEVRRLRRMPVPDEQAIERAIDAGWQASSSESMTRSEITDIARAVLAAALEQPE